MAERVYLGVDLGAESGRVVAGLFDGRTIRLDELHRFPNGPVEVAGTRRWDVLALWREIQAGMGKAAARYGSQIVSIGVDTWGVDYVLMSAKDEVLGHPYHYRDKRVNGMLAQACSRVSRKDIFAQTGIQFMELNTLYQLLAMQLSDPELLKYAARFLMMPDYLHWLMCGSRVVEFTNATTTQCFHPAHRQWATDLLRSLGIPTHFFPEVVPPGSRLGTLRDELSGRTGLPRIEVVAPATHDTGAAVAAVPTERTGRADWAYISSGTWSLIGVEVQDAILSDAALALNITNEGGIDGTYRLLKNVMGLWLVQECRRAFDRRGKTLEYEQLVQFATQAAPFRSFVNPDDARFLSPPDMVAAMQDYCRNPAQPVPETEGELVRCALESLALKYRQVLTGIESLTGERVAAIHVVGGGSKNSLLNQFTANACGRPVIAGPTEATALGNVLLQARTAGDVGTLADLRGIVRQSSDMRTFEPQGTGDWDAAYARFLALPN
ncbi:MAG: rhamnulokinase [Planctomycetaceae bacterium]|nr:rhamnulokinase [Planctomycetaceae bacterium]